jgi:hypothetical protein
MERFRLMAGAMRQCPYEQPSPSYLTLDRLWTCLQLVHTFLSLVIGYSEVLSEGEVK